MSPLDEEECDEDPGPRDDDPIPALVEPGNAGILHTATSPRYPIRDRNPVHRFGQNVYEK